MTTSSRQRALSPILKAEESGTDAEMEQNVGLLPPRDEHRRELWPTSKARNESAGGTRIQPTVTVPRKLAMKFPSSRYKVVPRRHCELGTVWFVQSHAGNAVDDMGQFYDDSGELLHTYSWVPLHRRSAEARQKASNWERYMRCDTSQV